jgi:large subunit ribosomal protein L10
VSITRQRKEQVLADLTGNLRQGGSIVLADFTGINVAKMTKLRSELRAAGVGFMVVKNTILRKAFDGIEVGGEPVVALAQGPTAIAWATDEILPVKTLKRFSQGNDGRPAIKGGFVSGRSLSAGEMMTLAELPGREELIARILGSMNAPLQGFVNVTGGVLRGFLNAVNAVKEKQEKDQ